MNKLQIYADQTKLTVNIEKTKCMIFHRGRCPNYNFFFQGNKLENCNNFTYLGIVFTSRLSSAKHVKYIISKCNSRIGYLFSKLPLKDIPIHVALLIFNTYILPIITYGLPIWFPELKESSKCQLNSVYTKFIKRYLGIPNSSRVLHRLMTY